MSEDMSEDIKASIERFETLLRSDFRYKPEAYNFVYEALDWTVKNIADKGGQPGIHVSCSELLEGIRQFGLERFGPLVPAVFSCWGVEKTDDWGEIVFNLIKHDLMGKQESDRKEAFRGVYNFAEVFDVELFIDYDETKNRWEVSYLEREKRTPASTRS